MSNQIFIFYFIFHFLFFIFQVSKIDWILHNYIYCNNIKVNDLNYYYSKYLYFSHFTISFTLFSYSIYIFFSYIYIYISYISIKYSFQNIVCISLTLTYIISITISKNEIYFQNPISLEKIKIFISIYPFQKSIFPVPDEKTVAKVKPRNIRWYFELVRHQYHLVSQAQISKGFTIAKSKRAFDPLCYTVLQSRGKNPCSTLSPWNIPPFLHPRIPIVYLPRANCEHERKFHPQSVTFKRDALNEKRVKYLAKDWGFYEKRNRNVQETLFKQRLNIYIFILFSKKNYTKIIN